MALISKLFTALKGGVNDVGDTIIDSQALRILDQEIREADEELKKAKESLANIMAEQKLCERGIAKIKDKIAEYEGYALQALAKNDEPLALEVAEKIAGFDAELMAQQTQLTGLTQSVNSLKQSIVQAETNIKNLKQQVDIVKATDSVQKAQASVAQRYGGSTAKLQTALDSLERIKKRQEKNAATIEAKNELHQSTEDRSLEEKLKQAGIKPSSQNAESILNRLKEKN